MPTLLVYDGVIPMNADSPLGDARLLSELPLELEMVEDGTRAYGRDFAANATGSARFGRIVGPLGSVVFQLRDEDLVLISESGAQTRTIVTGMHVRTDFVIVCPEPTSTSRHV